MWIALAHVYVYNKHERILLTFVATSVFCNNILPNCNTHKFCYKKLIHCCYKCTKKSLYLQQDITDRLLCSSDTLCLTFVTTRKYIILTWLNCVNFCYNCYKYILLQHYESTLQTSVIQYTGTLLLQVHYSYYNISFVKTYCYITHKFCYILFVVT